VPLGEPLVGHAAGVVSLAYDPAGRRLASGAPDGSVLLWDVASRTPLGPPLTVAGGWVSSVAFSADGRRLAAGSGQESAVHIWNVAGAEPQLETTFEGAAIRVDELLFQPESSALVVAGCGTAGPDGTCRRGSLELWPVDGDRGRPLMSSEQPFEVYTVALAPDGQTMAIGLGDGSIDLWDIATGQSTTSLAKLHGTGVVNLTFSPDGLILASSSNDSLRLWDVATGQPLGQAFRMFAHSLAFSPQAPLLAIGDPVGVLRLWNLDLGQWPAIACRIANRNLTAAEWDHYLPGEPYHPTCPDLASVSP
jgi:WD40 repeat protein